MALRRAEAEPLERKLPSRERRLSTFSIGAASSAPYLSYSRPGEHYPLERSGLCLPPAFVRPLLDDEYVPTKMLPQLQRVLGRRPFIGKFTRRVKFSRTRYLWTLYGVGWSFALYRQTSIRSVWTNCSAARHAITDADSPTPPAGARSRSISTSFSSWALIRSHSERVIVKTLRPSTLATWAWHFGGSRSTQASCRTLAHLSNVFSQSATRACASSSAI